MHRLFRELVLSLLFLIAATTIASSQQGDFPLLKGPYLGQRAPGTTPEIFAPGIVSTDMVNHSTISVSPDGLEIYWAMAPLDMPSRIYVTKMTKGIWSRPEIVSFTQSEDGDCPVLLPAGERMYFNSHRPLPGQRSRRERIWCVERMSGCWGVPFPLGPEINGEHLHWQISVDAVGNLFFGSERNGSKGRDDVFLAERLKDSYRRPISLRPEINTEAHEGVPFVAPDGQYLIFGRDGLWISFKGKNGRWLQAKSMGDAFDGAICPYVSPDQKFIFFLTTGMEHNDVMWISSDCIESLKPND